MKNLKSAKYLWVLLPIVAFLALPAFGAENLPHPDTYLPDPIDAPKIKSALDDPRDTIVTYPLEKAVPPEIYNLMTFDIEEAKKLTEELVGFKAPDLVGKIAPEIKPGKYTYEDLEKYPGLKGLFPEEFVQFIKPGGPPLVGNIPEFEIIPSRQFYWHLRFSEITKQNLGKAKQDKDGYIVPRSWQGGYPFPRPSGNHKAQQVYYNFEKRDNSFQYCTTLRNESQSFNKNLTRDQYSRQSINWITLMGRTMFPPYGWFDDRAEKYGEFQGFSVISHYPRARKGNVILQYRYDDPNKMDPWMIYLSNMRRVRKMSATDTQDPQGDMAYDDRSHCIQKITPKKYPYTFDIIAEREYLMPLSWNKANVWVDSKNGYALRNAHFMRRPCYVLQMNQLDPNYVYSKRILYIDKENFDCQFSANYDTKGRLYRTQFGTSVFLPKVASMTKYGSIDFQHDHIDRHSTFQINVAIPAPFEREDFKIQTLIKRGK